MNLRNGSEATCKATAAWLRACVWSVTLRAGRIPPERKPNRTVNSLTPDIRISDPVTSDALRRELDALIAGATRPAGVRATVRAYRTDLADALESSVTLAAYACPTSGPWERFVCGCVLAAARMVRP